MKSVPVPETKQIAAAWIDQRLSSEEQTLLTKTGFVSDDLLPSGNTAYKLRFRGRDRRQRVVYIGTNIRLAEAVRAEVKRLQSPLRQHRQRRALVAQARSALRAMKEGLEPAVASRGIHFHGYDLRRRRGESRSARPQDRCSE